MRKVFIAGFFLIAGARATELNTSILLFRRVDLDDCPTRVARAKALGNSKVNFVFTFYFDGDIVANTVTDFCFQDTGAECHPVRGVVGGVIKDGFKRCFKAAFDLQMDIAFLPHVDYAGEGGYWRNQLVFDPLADYGNTSYFADVIGPIADAIKETIPAARSADFVVAGEMGASVFHFAQSYSQIIHDLKSRFSGSSVNVAFSLNHNVVAGRDFTYTPEQLRAVQKLVSETDFLGISAYTALDYDHLSADELAKNITRPVAELHDLYGIAVSPSLPVQFSETGIGGGTEANDGLTLAPDPWQAARAPYSGIFAAYEIARDPWQNQQLKPLRKLFHQSLLDLISGGNPTSHALTGVFLWNICSWDVQGFFPGFESYADAEITDLIKRHNLAGASL